LNKKIILIGPLPPPYYGQSVGFKSFYEQINNNLSHYLINIQPKYSNPGAGWKMVRIFEYFFLLLKFLYYLVKTDNSCKVYITVGQSNASFTRDIMFFTFSLIFRRKVYAHLKGGNFKNFYSESNTVFKKLIQFFYKRVHKIIILGHSLLDNFDFCEVLKAKIIIVENGLSENVLEKKINYNKQKKSKLKIIFLSNLILSKGYLDLLESLRIMEKYTLNFSCIFAGNFYSSPDDPFSTNEVILEKLFNKSLMTLKNKKNVRYIGPVDNVKKTILLKNADIFVLPTYYVNEGQPISIIEAMAYKNVIISTPYRSIVDLISHNQEGFLVPPKSPQLIAKYLLDLYLNREKLLKMKKKSFFTYSNKFTKERHLKNLFNALDLN